MRTIGLSPDLKVQIISAYVCQMKTVNSVLSNPVWVVAGMFYMPATTVGTLEAIGQVSTVGRTLRVRLYDYDAQSTVINASVDFTSDQIVRVVSDPVDLVGGHKYQWQMQVFGSNTGTGTLYGATLI